MTLRQTMRRPVFDRAIVNLRNFHRLKISRGSLTIACLILAGLIGYADYLTGYKQSLLLFYFLPISLAAWFANFKFGIAIVAVCVMVWVLSDLASGIPALEFWNIGMAFASYVLFAGVVSELGILVRELDRRVDERTAAYEREMLERRRLDQEIAQFLLAIGENPVGVPVVAETPEGLSTPRLLRHPIPPVLCFV